jgi:hypothetical protein
MASFNEVNYLLRPNKNVERKLIRDCLKALEPRFGISQYAYIGMGSLWFVDFIFAHKELGIKNLKSIEKDEAERARFNRPYDCVTVAEGESTRVLADLDLVSTPVVVWLDYDSDLKGPWKEDLDIVCPGAVNGSVVILTVNAHRRQLDNVKDPNGTPLDRVQALRFLAGDVVPAALPRERFDTSRFPELIADLLLVKLERATRVSGRPERFVPLFNFSYKDRAPMVTVGGMIADNETKQRLDACDLAQRFDFVTGASQYTIDVPPLTQREKVAIDQLLPVSGLIDVEARLGWRLPESQRRAYQRFYKYYPVFAELHP